MNHYLRGFILFACGLATTGAAGEAASDPQSGPPRVALPRNWTEGERSAQRSAAQRVMREVQAAVGRGEHRYVVVPGDYRFDGPYTRDFVLEGVRNFAIEGEGATFWFHPRVGIRLKDCVGVTLRGLVIDTDPLPWWQGRIQSRDTEKKTMDIALDAGYVPPGPDEFMARRRVLFFDPTTNQELPLLDERVMELSVPDAGHIRIERFDQKNAFVSPRVGRNPVVGDRVVINNERWNGGNVHLENCADMVLEGLSLHGSANFAFHEFRGRGGNIYRNCRLIRRPGTGRLMASRGDAFHSMLMERGPIVENCELSAAGDDLIAVQGFFSVAMEGARNARELLIATPFGRGMRVGSTVQLVRLPNGETYAESKVVEMADVREPAILAAARALPEKMSLDRHVRIRKLSNVAVFRVRLDRAVDVHQYDLLSCSDFAGAGAIIRNNHLHDGHIRGILVKSRDVLIENNVIERTGHGGIVLEAELYWLEGPFNRGIRVMGNRVTDTGWSALDEKGVSVTLAGIQVGNYFGARLFPRMLTGGEQNDEIVIQNNQVIRPAAFPIWVRNTRRVAIEGNRIEQPFAAGPLPSILDLARLLSPGVEGDEATLAVLREPYYGILLQNVGEAALSGNDVSAAVGFVRSGVGRANLSLKP